MKFTARMHYYSSQRSCCVANFIARKFSIETRFLLDWGSLHLELVAGHTRLPLAGIIRSRPGLFACRSRPTRERQQIGRRILKVSCSRAGRVKLNAFDRPRLGSGRYQGTLAQFHSSIWAHQFGEPGCFPPQCCRICTA